MTKFLSFRFWELQRKLNLVEIAFAGILILVLKIV